METIDKKILVPVGEPARDNFFKTDYKTLQSYSFYDGSGNKIGPYSDTTHEMSSNWAPSYLFRDINGSDELLKYGSTDTLYYTKPQKESVGSRFTSYFRKGGKRSRKNRRGSKKLRKGGKKSRRSGRR